MNDMKEKHGDKLEVLCFPTNQFGFQEWFNGQEILDAATHVRPGKGFTPQFTFMEKCHANGEESHPVFTYLREVLPHRNTTPDQEEKAPFGTQPAGNFRMITYTPANPRDVIWNFEYFLISPDGTPSKRYHPTTYGDISADLDTILDGEEHGAASVAVA